MQHNNSPEFFVHVYEEAQNQIDTSHRIRTFPRNISVGSNHTSNPRVIRNITTQLVVNIPPSQTMRQRSQPRLLTKYNRSIMKLLCILVLSLAPLGFAFSPSLLLGTTTKSTHPHSAGPRRFSSSVSDLEETFYTAVQKAEKGHSRIDIDEYDRLATELENFEGVAYEKDSSPELGDKEIQDRLDVAEILRLQIELQLR